MESIDFESPTLSDACSEFAINLPRQTNRADLYDAWSSAIPTKEFSESKQTTNHRNETKDTVEYATIRLTSVSNTDMAKQIRDKSMSGTAEASTEFFGTE